MKIVINRCFGGFGLSDKAYKRLIELGVPVRKYINQPRNPATMLYEKVPENEGVVIFDRELTPKGEDELNDLYYEHPGSRLTQRYWEGWITYDTRNHPLLVKVVEELGEEANGWAAELEVVEIPDDVEYEIEDYDGEESIHEAHRSW